MLTPPFDPAAVLAALSLEEKASLLSGFDDWLTQPLGRPGLPYSVPSIEVGDGPHGLRKETGVDMVWVPATCFPTASALGASWDRHLVGVVAEAIGEEARAEGVQVVLGPGVNMKRSPLCGRNFEYFSEDPFHAGELGSAYVTGVQSTGVGTALKHFAANNQEIERTRISVVADERTLRETYLAAFERVVKVADPWTVMCSYNRIFGVHASQNHWLLTRVLRDEWGYGGAVISDWDAVHDRVEALRAGLDLEMPGTRGRTDAVVVAAIREERLDESIVDASALRVLELVARAYPGADQVDGPVTSQAHTPGQPLTTAQLELLQADAHHRIAYEAALGCSTLLRNEPLGPERRPALPLDEQGTGAIAVIGAFAQDARIQGGGSSGVEPTRIDAPLEAIRAIAGDRVRYAPGYVHMVKNAYQDDNLAILDAHGFVPTVTGQAISRSAAALREELQIAEMVQRLGRAAPSAAAQRLIEEAADVAIGAETVLVFAGLPLSYEQEANDRASLSLPTDQIALIERMADVCEQTSASLVVVLSNGSPVVMDPWHDRTDAVLEAWLGGQAIGTAVADILFGRANPSGKLAETFPLALEDTPGFPNWRGERGTVLYGEGVFIGYRWYDALERDVRYPFGHGLSYTRFGYRDLSIQVLDLAAGRVLVSCTVTNEGDRVGAEVVQLYVGDPDSEVQRPIRELRGFDKVVLQPGEAKEVVFTLENRDFAYWDSVAARAEGGTGLWRREGGDFCIEIGSSSRDIRLSRVIELPDDPMIPALIPDALLLDRKESRFVHGYAG